MDKISWLDNLTNGYSYIVYVFLIVFLTLLVTYIEKRIYKKLVKKLDEMHRVWEGAFIKALHVPLVFLIWVMGLLLAFKVLIFYTQETVFSNAIPILRSLGTVAFFVWFCVNFIREAESALTKPRPGRPAQDPTTVKAISQLLRVAVIVTATLVLMQTFNIPVSGVVATGGAGAIVAGLAAKDWIANFFGGFMIFLDRPFKIGDWIRSPDKEIEGTVEQIGWRLTRIRTFDKRPLYVPNAVFSTISLENPSRMTNRRIKTTVGLRYQDAAKLKTILEQVEEMLKNHPEIDTNMTLFVRMVEFGPSSLNFLIYTFTKTTNWVKFQAIQQDVFLKIIDIITENGAECAFPTTTLHVPDGIGIKS